jgi:hypothetical protein
MAWMAQWVARLFSRLDSHRYLAQQPHWRIVGLRDFSLFFRRLPDLIPSPSQLYIENTDFSAEVAQFLNRHAVVNPARTVQRGTILPRPRFFHVPVSDAVMAGLAEISERHAEAEVAVHMVAYNDREILLEWYDAGLDPIFLSRTFAEATVAAFCTKTGTKYDEQI